MAACWLGRNRPKRVWCIEVFQLLPENGPASVARHAEFERALQALGWTVGRNLEAVGGGFVESLAHPGGNATGVNSFEYGVSANGSSCSKRL